MLYFFGGGAPPADSFRLLAAKIQTLILIVVYFLGYNVFHIPFTSPVASQFTDNVPKHPETLPHWIPLVQNPDFPQR